jgi:hypothetical protein
MTTKLNEEPTTKVIGSTLDMAQRLPGRGESHLVVDFARSNVTAVGEDGQVGKPIPFRRIGTEKVVEFHKVYVDQGGQQGLTRRKW